MVQMNLFKKQEQTHGPQNQTYGYPRGKAGRRRDWGFGTGIYTLLNMELMVNGN